VVLADTQTIARYALRCLLGNVPEVKVIGEVSDGRKVATVVARLKPDVVIIDFELTGLSALDVPLDIRRRAPRVGIVVLSPSLRNLHVIQAFRNGASAYVVKRADPKELIKAILKSAVGEKYISAPLSRRPVSYWVARADHGPRDEYDTLTLREREVLHLVGQGMRAINIARRLAISPRTVEAHRARIKAKLGLPNHPAMVRYSVERQMTIRTINATEGEENGRTET
jgi:two-component system, NarL family, response regulator NreC